MLSINKLYISFSLFFLIWVYLNNIFLDYKLSLLILLIIVIFFINFFMYEKKYFIIIFPIIIWFCLWVFVSNLNINKIEKNNNYLEYYYKINWYNNIDFEILSVSKINDFDVEYISKIKEIDNQILNQDIYFLSKIPINFSLKKWDILNSKIRFNKIENYNDFDYQDYMLSRNIYFTTYVNIFSNVWYNKPNKFIYNLDNYRQYFLSIIKSIYPKEEAIYLWWILLWARESIDKDLKQSFNNSGLTHIIAVSWFNITILVIFVWFIVKFLPVYFRLIIISFVIISFTFLVWPSASVIRASIMWLVAYFILISWRKWDSLSILIFSCFLMILFSPFSLNYDISFHLSFLAVLWIIYTQNFFSKIFSFLPNILSIKEAIVMTFSALAFTLPIMIFNFWQLSILSPISNLLVIWTIPISMLLWFLSILLYLIYPMIWYVFWYFWWIFLKYDIMVVRFMWGLDFSILRFDFWIYKNYFMFLYFLIMFFLVIYFKKSDYKSV